MRGVDITAPWFELPYYLFIYLFSLHYSPPPFKNRSAWFNTFLQCQARQIAITSHAQELIKAVGDFDQPWSVVMNNLDTWSHHEAQKRQKILLQAKYYAIIDLEWMILVLWRFRLLFFRSNNCSKKKFFLKMLNSRLWLQMSKCKPPVQS